MPPRPTLRMGSSLLLPVLACVLAAQEPAPKPPETWAAESRPVAVDRTPGQVAVFDEEAILRSGARTLGEFLLRELPSQVQSEGGPGLPSRIYLGGSRPQDTLVMVDGMPLMDPGRVGQDLNEIPLLGITRVEVITGSPGSGPSGQGGTIALYTGRPTRPGVSGDLGGLGGNNGQGQGTATPGYAWDGGYFRGGNLSAEAHQATDTDRPYRQVTNFLSAGQVWGSAVWHASWRGTAIIVPDPFQDVSESMRTYNPARESHQRSDTGQVAVDWDLAPGWRLATSLGLARFRHDQPGAGTAVPTRFEGRDTRFQSILQVTTGSRSSLGLRLDAQDTRQDGGVDPVLLGSAKGTQVGLGLEWTFEPTPGLRLLGQARSTRDRQSLDQAGAQTEVLSASGYSFRLGFNQELPAGLRIYGAGGGGRTAPALLDQLRNGQVPGAPPLRMEQATSLQIGLGWGRGHWYGRVEGRQQTGKDLVGLSGSTYANQDRVRVRGTDAAFGWRTAEKLGLEGFARVQEARDLNAPDGQSFSTLAVQRRPFSAHGLKGFVGWGRVQTEVHYTLQGHQYSTFGDGGGRAAANGLPPVIRATHVAYRTVGMTTTVQAGPHWLFLFRGENLLQPRTTPDQWLAAQREGQNDAYVVDGYPAAPPSWSVEARYRF